MKKLIERMAGLWKRLFGADKKLEHDVKKVIRVVAAIKKAADNPGVDALTQLIPGEIDDHIVKAVRAALDKVLKITGSMGIPAESVPKEPLLRNAVLHKTASLAVMDLHSLKESDADTLVQIVYNQEK